MESIGEKMTEADIRNLMREADTDGDGRVNFEGRLPILCFLQEKN